MYAAYLTKPKINPHRVTENDFIRRQRLQVHDSVLQVLAYPMWKICSDYHDCITPIRANLQHVVEFQTDLGLFILTLTKINYENPHFQAMLRECASCIRTYFSYLMKLRCLIVRTNNLSNILHYRKEIMIECHQRRYGHLEAWQRAIICDIFDHKISYVMYLCIVAREQITDSIRLGKTVLECSIVNLLQATRFYYRQGIPIPEGPPVLRNLMADILVQQVMKQEEDCPDSEVEV